MQSLFLGDWGGCVRAEVVFSGQGVCPGQCVCAPGRVCALARCAPWAALTVPLSCPQESAVLPLLPSRTGHTAAAPGTPSPSGTWSPTPAPRGWSWLGTPPCPAPLRMGRTARGEGQCRGAKVQLGVCPRPALPVPATRDSHLHLTTGRQLTPLI